MSKYTPQFYKTQLIVLIDFRSILARTVSIHSQIPGSQSEISRFLWNVSKDFTMTGSCDIRSYSKIKKKMNSLGKKLFNLVFLNLNSLMSWNQLIRTFFSCLLQPSLLYWLTLGNPFYLRFRGNFPSIIINLFLASFFPLIWTGVLHWDLSDIKFP